MRSITITCLHCGITTTLTSTGFHKTPQYCSKQCRHDHALFELHCIRCGKAFYRNSTRVRRNEKYCSDICYNLARAKETHGITCKYCGNLFYVKTSHPQRYTICKACQEYRSKPICTCERCGKTFKGDKRYQSRYCSEKCYRPPVYITCLTCGKQHRVEPAQSDKQFCSFACYRKSTCETLIEKAIRLQLESLNVSFAQEAKIGRYHVDFLIPDIKLVIEVDGTYWHNMPRQIASDKRKDAFLGKSGYMVIRFSEKQIKDDIERCVETMRMLFHL